MIPHISRLKWKLRVALTRLGLWSSVEYFRHWLSFHRGLTHEGDFHFLKKFRGRPFFAVDIGANEGQSALSIRVVLPQSKILSLEPNPALRPYLNVVSRILGSDFEFRILGCGFQKQVRELFVPWVNGVQLSQEATFDQSFLTEDVTTQERILGATGSKPDHISVERMEILPLDDLQLNPDFIKIDVQGLELEVLKGARATIQKYRPLIMVENGTSLGPVFEELASQNYLGFRFDPKNQRLSLLESGDLTSLNVFFVYQEGEVGGR